MFYIQQSSESGCGTASLKMLLANLRKDKRYLFIPEKEGKATSYKEIISLAKKEGLFLNGFRLDRKEEIIKNDNWPLIATIVPEEGLNHSVVVLTANPFYVKFLDPVKGPVKMKLKKFLSLWDGTGLIIEKDEYDGFHHQTHEIENKSSISGIVLQVLSGIMCILGIYFINNKTHIVVPVIFLSLFVVFELSRRFLLFKSMKEIDKTYAKDLKIRKSDFNLYFQRLENFKKLSLVTPMDFVGSLVVVMFVIFILIINGFSNIFLVAMPLFLCLLEVILFKPSRRKEEAKVERKERNISSLKDTKELENSLEEIHSDSYKIATEELGKRYLNILLMILSSLFTLFVSKELNLVQGVFYLLSQLILFDHMNKVFMYPEKVNEFNLAKVKLMNIIHKDEIL